MAVATPITATVEYISNPKESTYNPGQYYYSTLFLDESLSGDEAKIWKSLSGHEVTQIRKGDRVQLVPSGKDKSDKEKHTIVLLGGSAPSIPYNTPTPTHAPAPAAARPQDRRKKITAPAAARPQESREDRRKKITAYVGSLAALYGECYCHAGGNMPDAPEETVRCAASSIFIQACRKFDL